MAIRLKNSSRTSMIMVHALPKLKSIQSFWSMIFMAYAFLKLFRVSNKKKLKFITLGDTIGYFRKQQLVAVVKYAYNCAENGVTIDAAFAKLGLVA